jgi:hypothetical protein
VRRDAAAWRRGVAAWRRVGVAAWRRVGGVFLEGSAPEVSLRAGYAKAELSSFGPASRVMVLEFGRTRRGPSPQPF